MKVDVYNIETVTEELARAMYDDYCVTVGGKAFNGEPLPSSSEFFTDSTKIKQASGWRAAAMTAIDYLKQ